MKQLRFLLPLGAAAATALLVLPTDTDAFSTLGSSQSVVNERDVRVFNNFGDSTVNEDTTVDSNFPGYDGAERAIWKACVEWGSRPHGSGNGDTSQPGGLGSGGANFDITWQGNANAVGGFSNIHSQISGSNGGVYAYCEQPGFGDGWRIRYYEDPWVWDDGPGPLPGGRTDLQGIATHEFGHALGLGHTDASPATMRGSVSQSGSYFARSIETDDINGVKAIYGVAASNKPIIVGLSNASPGVVEVNGSNFAATNNEVWFTQAGVGGSGDAVKVTGLVSTGGGTKVTALIPLQAGSGDVLVKVPGTGHNTLSNAWPIDIAEFDCTWDNFCVGLPNSTGVGATMSAVGSTKVSENDFSLNINGLPVGTIGIHYVGNSAGAGAPFGNGINCVTGPVLRFGVAISDPIGGTNRQIDFGGYPGNQMSADGTPWYFQFWYRNPAGGQPGFNTSNGVVVTFCP